jgi:hypothetical protein
MISSIRLNGKLGAVTPAGNCVDLTISFEVVATNIAQVFSYFVNFCRAACSIWIDADRP